MGYPLQDGGGRLVSVLRLPRIGQLGEGVDVGVGVGVDVGVGVGVGVIA